MLRRKAGLLVLGRWLGRNDEPGRCQLVEEHFGCRGLGALFKTFKMFKTRRPNRILNILNVLNNAPSLFSRRLTPGRTPTMSARSPVQNVQNVQDPPPQPN